MEGEKNDVFFFSTEMERKNVKLTRKKKNNIKNSKKKTTQNTKTKTQKL